MIRLLLLLMMAVPQQSGKVIVNTHVPGAEFYLDGNFVAVTNAAGELSMENFPAGSFSYSIVKQGYQPYKGSFSIGEGETQQLTPTLDRLKEPEKPGENANRSAGSTPAAVSLSKIADRNKSAAVAPPRQMETPAAGSPVVPPPPGQDSPKDSEANTLPMMGLILLPLILLALWIIARTRKHPEQRVASPAPAPEMEPLPPTDGVNRPAPVFIEELKRREELIKAGFVASKPQVIDPMARKEKEVVIVLPKEAFRIEDDK